MLARQKATYHTPEEYLALEEKADCKSEYYQGEIFAMSGASINHNRIANNLNAVLNVAFETKPCEAFSSDMRLLVKKNGLYTYPDVMVVCGKPQFVEGRDDTITNPVVIVEVLSKSTRDYDRGAKFELYRATGSFQDYVLIDQERPYIEYFHKLEDGRWLLSEFSDLDATLTLEAIDFTIPIRRIYHKVDWTTG